MSFVFSGVYLLQCVQMNVNSDLCTQFIWQTPQHFLFIYRLLIRPEVVKPANDTLLQDLADMSKVHIVFEGVHAGLKACSRCVHVGDHGSNIANNGGKNQNTDLEQKANRPVFSKGIYVVEVISSNDNLTKKSNIKNRYSSSLTGGGVSPMVVSVRVDQYRQYM